MRETRGNRQKAASLTLSDAQSNYDYDDDGNAAADYLNDGGFPQFGTKVVEQFHFFGGEIELLLSYVAEGILWSPPIFTLLPLLLRPF